MNYDHAIETRAYAAIYRVAEITGVSLETIRRDRFYYIVETVLDNATRSSTVSDDLIKRLFALMS